MRQSKRDLFQKSIGGAALAASALTLRGASAVRAQTAPDSASGSPGAVYAMTNELTGNRVMVYKRAADGLLTPGGSFPTGGMGSGTFENSANGLILSGQSPDNLRGGNRYLFATDAGSNSVAVFAVEPQSDGLVLVDSKPSGGVRPFSVTARRNLLYVLNSGGPSGMGIPPNITGFRIGANGTLTPIPGSTRSVAGGSTSGVAQIGFNNQGNVLVVTERGNGAIIDTYLVDQGTGLATGPIANSTPNIMGPFGFTFTQRDQLLVCMNRGGFMGLGSASSFAVPNDGVLEPISGPVDNGRSDTCWFTLTDNNKYGYVTNFQSGDISSYRVAPDGVLTLLQPIAAVVGPPESGPADEALSQDSKFLYVRVISDGTIRAFKVDQDTGVLTPIQTLAGLPPLSAIGIAAK
ncbi:MAG TPA: beta-propeller fold lactonase family protein [Chloroflexota bacterium]|nr:beta-propeller fold lactonase family protein [Chloroflexota bacterium]